MIDLGKVACRFVGDYSSTTQYGPADVVNYNGNSYGCRKACTGVAPTDTEYWQIIITSSSIATTSSAGTVKPDGTTITVDPDGTIHGASTYSLPEATSSTLGGVKIGSGVNVASDGTISVDGYTLPEASTTTLGGVKPDGTSITADADGTIHSVNGATPYTLPTASTDTLGGVKVDGSTITIDGNGVISGSSSYTLPEATETTLGGVMVDGTTITINNGVISAVGGGGGGTSTTVTLALEGAKEDTITITDANGFGKGAVIFESGATTGTITVSVAGSEELTFKSSVSNYEKTVDISTLEDIYIPLVPTMTSNTAPEGEASASSADGCSAYYVFNGNYSGDIGTRWVGNKNLQSDTSNWWIQYKFDVPTCVNYFSLWNSRAYGSQANWLPKDFELKASNDGTTWATLGTYSNADNSDLVKISYSVNNTNTYQYYRIVITSCTNTTDEKYVAIQEIQFYTVTKGVKLIPEGAVYWYGNNINIGNSAIGNGGGHTATFETNSIKMTVGSSGAGIALQTANNVDVSSYSKLKATITNTATSDNNSCFAVMRRNATAWTSSELDGNIIARSSIAINATSLEVAFSGVTSAGVLMLANDGSQTLNFYAVWFE